MTWLRSILTDGLPLPHFAVPWILAGLFLPAALGVWIWRRRSRRTAVPFDHGTASAGNGWWTMISLAETAIPVLLAIAILMAAIPLTLGNPVNDRKLSNIEFCVDCSGSMTAPFGDGTRYDASMQAINQFVEIRRGDAFGLTFFATSVVRWCPLTTDSSAFRCALPFMKPASSDAQMRTIGGGTKIGMALLNCRKVLLEAETGDRMVILVSDGISGDLNDGRDMEIGKQLLRDNIVVYGIHIGGGDVPEQILNLTSATGGEAFVSGDVEGLESIFRRIDSMEPAEFEVMEVEQIESFRIFAAIGMACFGVWIISLFGLRYTPW